MDFERDQKAVILGRCVAKWSNAGVFEASIRPFKSDHTYQNFKWRIIVDKILVQFEVPEGYLCVDNLRFRPKFCDWYNSELGICKVFEVDLGMDDSVTPIKCQECIDSTCRW